MSVLERIAASVARRVEEARAAVPVEELRARAAAARVPHDFGAALRAPGTRVIAEVKLASPSAGDIAPGADPVAVAGDYLAAGAAAISVVTERDFFRGHPASLRAIRAAHPSARLLQKDFFVDEYQLLSARVDGADAVLLIVALLGERGTRRFLDAATALGLAALVEVHDEAELAVAVAAGARLVGVNNRDLRTFEVTLDTSLRLAPLAPPGVVLVSESGITSPADVRRLAAAGCHALLVGSHLMRSAAPGAALRALLGDVP